MKAACPSPSTSFRGVRPRFAAFDFVSRRSATAFRGIRVFDVVFGRNSVQCWGGPSSAAAGPRLDNGALAKVLPPLQYVRGSKHHFRPGRSGVSPSSTLLSFGFWTIVVDACV